MKLSELEGKRVAIWGYGHEGRSTLAALRWRLPRVPLALLCSASEAAEAMETADPALYIFTEEVTADLLARFDVVIKSPGISPYHGVAAQALARGVTFTSGTALWFSENPGARTICVTGTKGKSTTTALIAHLLRAGGVRTALAGNIGLPLLELLEADPPPQINVVELSSYQTRDAVAPEVAVVLNLFPEHLDWHGSEDRYIADKLALVTQAKPRIAVLNAADPLLAKLQLPDSDIHWYGDGRGWHLREDALYRGDAFIMDTAALPLPGRHNRSNLCAVLTALEAFGLDAAALAARAASFQPLPNRLQPLGERDGVLYVNDSISTTPMATQAALDVYAGRDVAVLVGGHDRGLPWDEFADAMREHAPRAVITMGQNGPRIHALLMPVAAQAGFVLEAAGDLADAMDKARSALPDGGVVLLSPGAPSFGPYRNYVERGRHFAWLAGFDPDAISGIQGMGIA